MADGSRITRTPGVCGGKACIAGHRIRVLDIVAWHEHQGMTPDEIVSHFPTMTLTDVHVALAYSFDHIEEIREEMPAERAFAEKFRRSHPSLLDSKLHQEKLALPSTNTSLPWSRQGCAAGTSTSTPRRTRV